MKLFRKSKISNLDFSVEDGYGITLGGVYRTTWPTGGGIGGSGTTNYLTKWNPASTTLSNSQIYDNGTNVGIGTESPSDKLHVSGGNLRISNHIDTGNMIYLADDNNSSGENAHHAIHVQTQGTTHSYLSTNGDAYFSGNVGIGTTSPSYKLHVQTTDGASSAKIGYTSSYTDNRLFFGDGSYVYVGENGADDRLYLYGSSMAISIGGSVGASGNVLTSNGTTCSWVAPSGGGGSLWTDAGTYNYSNNNSYVRVYDNGNTDYMFYLDKSATPRRGIYVFNDDYQAGTGYTYTTQVANIVGYDYNSQSYEFAIAGNDELWYNKSGAVLGVAIDGSPWGCLAYQLGSSGATGGTEYAGYGTAAWTTGSGRLRPSRDDNRMKEKWYGIGSGWYGGVMGGWVRGEVAGFTSSGPLYASYNLGNEYTTGVQGNIHTVGEERIASYSIASPDVKIYADGSGNLKDGSCYIEFEEAFKKIISSETRPNVVVTPLAECNGIYISEISENGFTVVENNAGRSNIEFSWIAIGKRAGYETRPILPEPIARIDFDNNLSGIMHDENDSVYDAIPVWWDGRDFRYEPDGLPKEPEQPMPEVSESSNPAFFDSYGNQIPPEWVAEFKAEGVEMFTYDEAQARRKQAYLDNARAVRKASDPEFLRQKEEDHKREMERNSPPEPEKTNQHIEAPDNVARDNLAPTKPAPDAMPDGEK